MKKVFVFVSELSAALFYREWKENCWHKMYEKAFRIKNVNDIALTVYSIALIMH